MNPSFIHVAMLTGLTAASLLQATPEASEFMGAKFLSRPEDTVQHQSSLTSGSYDLSFYSFKKFPEPFEEWLDIAAPFGNEHPIAHFGELSP